MTNFYILLAAAFLSGCIIGYLLGFTRFLFSLINIAASALAAFFLAPFVSRLLSNIDSLAVEWSKGLGLALPFIILYIVLHIVCSRLIKYKDHWHRNIINRIAGAVAVAGFSIMLVITAAQFNNTMTIPAQLNNYIHDSGMEQVFNAAAQIVNEQFAPITEEQPVQVMAMETVDPVNEQGIVLPFLVNDFSINASLEASMLQMINKERRKYNLQPLVTDPQLTIAARKHSEDMFRRGYFSHNTPEGIDPFQRLRKLNISYLYAGENLAMAPTLLRAHISLMNSTGHRANILNRSFRKVGIGILDSGNRGLMITQEFKD